MCCKLNLDLKEEYKEAEHIIIEDGCSVIPDDAFARCENLQSVSLPRFLLHEIDDFVFRNTPKLNDIKIVSDEQKSKHHER